MTIPQSPCYTGLRVPRSSSNHTISGQSPPIAARGEAAVVSGHSPLCRASVGTVKPPTKPPRAVTCSPSGCLATRLLGVPKILLMLCTEKNVLGSDCEAPLDADQGGGRLEFTCLPPERDTMWTAWAVPLTHGDLDVLNVMTWCTGRGRSRITL